MFLHATSLVNTMFATKHYNDGLNPAMSGLSQLVEADDNTIQTISERNLDKLKKKRKYGLDTQESAHTSRKRTWNAKSKTSKSSTQTLTRPTPTLALASTGSDVGFCQFWAEFTREKSQKLWSCTKTDCVDSDPSSWSGSLKKLGANSWFTTRKTQWTQITQQKSLPTTSLQSQQSLWRDIMEIEQLKTEKDGGSKQKKKPKKRVCLWVNQY